MFYKGIVRLIVTVFVSFLLLIGPGCSRRNDDAASGEPGATRGLRWHTYLDMALREAQRDDRQVFVTFYSRDCALCKTMDDSVYTDKDVQALLSNLVTVRIALDADSTVTESLRVREHPTGIFLTRDGTEIDRIVGYTSASAFLGRAREILSGSGTLQQMLAQEPARSNDPVFLLELGQKLYHRRDHEGALARLDAAVAADPRNQLGATDKALFLSGRILNEASRFEESIVRLSRLIEEFPTSTLVPDARLFRAVDLLSIRGRNQEGVDELKLIIRDHPGTQAASWAREQLMILSQPAPPPSGGQGRAG